MPCHCLNYFGVLIAGKITNACCANNNNNNNNNNDNNNNNNNNNENNDNSDMYQILMGWVLSQILGDTTYVQWIFYT